MQRVTSPLSLGTVLLTLALLAPHQAAAYDPIEWAPSLADAQRVAREQGRLVLLHFWSESCPPCMRLERTVFHKREFVNALQGNYVPVKVNVEFHGEIAQQYGIRSIPTDVIITPDGQEVHRSISPADANRYIAMLDEVAAHNRLGQVAPPPTSLPLSETTTVAGLPHSTAPAATPAAQKQVVENPFARSLPAERATGHAGYSQQLRAPAEPAQPTAPQPGLQPTPLNSSSSEQAALGQPLPRRSRYTEQTVSAEMAAAPGRSPVQDTMPNPATSGPPRSTAGRSAARPPAGADTLNPAPSPAPAERTATIERNQPWAAEQGAPVVPPAQERSGAAAQAMNQSLSRSGQSPAPIVRPPAPPPLGLDGFCPVSLVDGDRWQPGDARWQAAYQQRTYYFAGPRERELFVRDPARYSPAMSGFDVVLYRDQGVLVPGKREHGLFAKDEHGVTQGYYLFADEQSLERFCRASGQAAEAPARQ